MAQSNKLPPQNIEAEQSLLGALLIDRDAIVRIGEILHPSHFYRTEQHGRIYEAILQLYEKREPIDIVTVTEKLRQTESLDIVGGSAYLSTLVNLVPTSAHIEHYAHIIKEHAIRRNLINQSTKLVEVAYDESVPLETVLDTAEQGIFNLSQQSVKRDFVGIKDLLTVSFDRLDELQKTSGKLRGVPTGFRDLDNMLAGMQDSNLIIFAARPGAGKCLAYDSKIIHPETGERLTIEEYYKSQIKPIFTLDPHLKLAKTVVANFVDDGLKEVFKVKTSIGREIEVTSSHPFLTVSGWKQLAEIEVGTKVALPRELPVFGQLNLEDYKVKSLAYFLTDGGLTGVCPRFTNSNPKVAEDFEQSVSSFGQVVVRKYDSNGSRTPSYEVVKDDIDKATVKNNFSHQFKAALVESPVVQAQLAHHLNVSPSSITMWANGEVIPSESNLNLLSAYFKKPRSYFLDDNFSAFQAKNNVTLWLEELALMGKSALIKSVPEMVFTLTREKLALFLNRMFACDGGVFIRGNRVVIGYSSSSKVMIDDVQHLLLRFGIVSKVREKQVKYKETRRLSYELEITSSADIITFCQEIGIFGKEEKVKRAYQIALNTISLNNFTRDTIPLEVWEVVLKAKGKLSWREVYKRLGLPISHNIHAGKRNPKRSTILKLAQALDNLQLRDLALSDIFWDKVISIESQGIKQVYDLTVPETHNFVANDFYVHNTSFVLNVAQYVAVKANIPVGIFSLEMSQEEIVDRFLVGQADIDAWKLKTGRLDEKDFDRLSHAMGELAEAPLFIDDTPGLSIAEIRTKARRLQMEHGLKLLIVDYLQLIHGRTTDNRVQEVAEISQGLKNLARELKIPVFACAQLSRAVESRGSKRPQLSDLRESGSIEQDADVVMFIYREDPTKNEDVTLDIQKHRNGPMGEIKLIFRGDRTKFYGMEKTRIAAAPKKAPSTEDIEKEMAQAA